VVLTDIRAHTADDLQARFQAWGQPPYRLSQLLEWLYVHRVTQWEAMTNLPRTLREQLREHFTLQALELVRQQRSRDTVKFLWRLDDRSLIESVLIPANPALYGEPSDRHTLCLSTQVGCPYGCKFCASGLAGWKRNLRVDEIVNQVLAVERWNEAEKSTAPRSPSRPAADAWNESPTGGAVIPRVPNGESSQPASVLDNSSTLHSPPPEARSSSQADSRLVTNLVIMGMGEPLANYDNLIQALKILNAPWGGGIGARKITISTSGLAPQIRKLADEPLPFRLAISLQGATDALRNRLMPVNRKYPLRELAAAGEYYQEKKGRRISFEYVLIAGVNDGLDQVKPLAALARRLNAKVNLIPYNRVEGLPWARPPPAAQQAFLQALAQEQVAVTLRREKGHDLEAACGQLRLKTERELTELRKSTTPRAGGHWR
jgi:23S rRNA (adenine2503-C2)-methyltransferase